MDIKNNDYIKRVINNLLIVRKGNLKEYNEKCIMGNCYKCDMCSICGDTACVIEIIRKITIDNKDLCIDCYRIQSNM